MMTLDLFYHDEAVELCGGGDVSSSMETWWWIEVVPTKITARESTPAGKKQWSGQNVAVTYYIIII